MILTKAIKFQKLESRSSIATTSKKNKRGKANLDDE